MDHDRSNRVRLGARWAFIGALAAGAIAVTAGAAGATTVLDSSTPPDSAPPDSATPDSTPMGSAAAGDLDAQLAALLETQVELPMVSDPVDPGTHTVAIVSSGLASTGPALVVTNIEEALGVIGWETTGEAWDGEFTPTDQAAGIERAVQDDAEAIFLVSITPAAVSAAVQAATDAGIPMICILCGPGLPEGMVGIGYEPVKAGDAQAIYAVANSEEDATIVVFQNTEFEASRAQMEQAAAKAAELCPTCTIETPSLLLGEARELNAPVFTSLLDDHPEGELDFVLMPFDTPAAALANTAAQLGREDFGIIGFGALSPFIDMVGTGEPATAVADILISTPFYGWIAVDQAARVLADVPTWDTENFPVAIGTQDNFGELEPGLPFVLPVDDYEAQFAELWGR